MLQQRSTGSATHDGAKRKIMSNIRGIVWILGAGFSRFLGGPLLNELLTIRAAQRIATVYNGEEAQAVSEFEAIARLFEAGLPSTASNGKAQWQHAEEFLEQLALAAENPTQRRLLVQWSQSSEAVEQGVRGVTEDSVPALYESAVRMLVAECCLFLEEANPKLERWAPYRSWAQALDVNDTILTFNYDRVVELVGDARKGGVSVPTPSELADTLSLQGVPCCLKLHGSVDWKLHQNRVEVDPHPTGHAQRAIMRAHVNYAIATPGPAKYRMVAEGAAALKPLWTRAEEALRCAEAVVIVGYSMPASDSSTKQWLVDALRFRVSHENKGVVPINQEAPLPVHTVLGPDLTRGPVLRINGLLGEVHPQVRVHPWDMGAEDFLGLIPRARLVHAPR
jgi:hypothetical protein